MNSEINKNVKSYGFLSFAKSFAKNLSNKFSQKLSHSDEKSTRDSIKISSKWAIQKTPKRTGD